MSTSREEVIVRLGVDKSAFGPGMRDARKDTDHATEGIELFNTHGREMHKLVHLLDHAVPGLGAALRLAFHPATFGIAVIVLAVEGLISWMHKAKEKAIELVNKQIESVEAFKKANAEATQAEAESARAFEKIMSSAQQSVNDIIKQKHAERMQLLDAEVAQYKKLIDAQEAREMAAAKGDPAAQAEIRKRYEALRNEFDIQSQLEKLQIKRNEVAERKGADKFLAEKLATLKAAQTDLNNDEGFKAAKARLENANKGALAKQVAELSLPGWEERLFPSTSMAAGSARRAREEKLKVAEDALDRVNRDEEIKKEHDAAQKRLTETVGEVAKQYTENGKAMSTLTEEIKMTEKVSRIERKKKLPGTDTLSLDAMIEKLPISPKLQQFLDLRNRLLSKGLSAEDKRLGGDEAKREFAALSITDKIKALQSENLPKTFTDKQREAVQNELQFFLQDAVKNGIKVKLPTDD